MLPDHLNPRLWLRDWLNKPTATERKASEDRIAAMGDIDLLSNKYSLAIDPETGLIIGRKNVEAAQSGLDAEIRDRNRGSAST